MGCCNDSTKYVDPSCRKAVSWDEVTSLLGLDACRKLVPVEKPVDMDELDKLAIIRINGNGDSALYDDGVYRETYTKAQTDDIAEALDTKIDNTENELREYVDDSIATATQDAVTYDSSNEVNLRASLNLPNGAILYGRTANGNRYALLTNGNGAVVVGNTFFTTSLSSSDRPTIILPTGSEAVAYYSEVQGVLQSLDSLSDEYNVFKASVNASLLTLSDELNDVRSDVAQNTLNISINTSEIEQLRQELNNQDHFRGSFLTTAEVNAIANPENGDYAYNLETGTIWGYSTTGTPVGWSDTMVAIPSGVYALSDDTPLTSTTAGSAGTATTISRSDHRHPSDPTKADVSLLDDYLPLAGNTQTTPMTGPIWTGTGNDLYLSDSGNTSIGINQPLAELQIISGAVGGVNLISDLGTIKANGKVVLTNGANEPIATQAETIALTTTATGGSLSMGGPVTALRGPSVSAISTTGSVSVTAATNVVLTPTQKAYYGSAANPDDEIATIGDIVNTDDFYTKTEADALLDLKADKAQTVIFGDIQAVGSLSNIPLSTTYDIRYANSSGDTSAIFSLTGGINGYEYIVTIDNTASIDPLVVTFTNTSGYQIDYNTLTVGVGRIAEVSVKVIGTRYVIRIIGA